eukprot:scaffold14613_cov59-Phaeocystis_antarctica.AAC.4
MQACCAPVSARARPTWSPPRRAPPTRRWGTTTQTPTPTLPLTPTPTLSPTLSPTPARAPPTCRWRSWPRALPSLNTVAASITYGCSLYYIRLQVAQLAAGVTITTVAQSDGRAKPLTAPTLPCVVERDAYAPEGSNQGLADRVPGRSAAHTCEPRPAWTGSSTGRMQAGRVQTAHRPAARCASCCARAVTARSAACAPRSA